MITAFMENGRASSRRLLLPDPFHGGNPTRFARSGELASNNIPQQHLWFTLRLITNEVLFRKIFQKLRCRTLLCLNYIDSRSL